MLSIAINIKNGEATIDSCLLALIRFDDIVILDNYSTDNTIEIINKHIAYNKTIGKNNIRLYQSEFIGMSGVRNQLATFSKYDWIFFVDCDEILTHDLVDYLLNMSNSNLFEMNTLYKVKRHNYYNNHYINAASWGNEYVIRIYNKNQTRFVDEHLVHETLLIQGHKIQTIEVGFMYHFPYKQVSELINKMQFYSTLYAKQYYAQKHASIINTVFRSLFTFLKSYILKKGFLYGRDGFVISCYNAIGVFTKYLKLYELRYNQDVYLQLNIVVAEFLHEVLKDNVEGIFNITNAYKQRLEYIFELIAKQSLLPKKVIISFDVGVVSEQLQYNHEVITKHLNNLNVILDQVVREYAVVPYVIVDNFKNSNNTNNNIINNNLVVLGALTNLIPSIKIDILSYNLSNDYFAKLFTTKFFKKCYNLCINNYDVKLKKFNHTKIQQNLLKYFKNYLLSISFDKV